MTRAAEVVALTVDARSALALIALASAIAIEAEVCSMPLRAWSGPVENETAICVELMCITILPVAAAVDASITIFWYSPPLLIAEASTSAAEVAVSTEFTLAVPIANLCPSTVIERDLFALTTILLRFVV